MNIVVLLAGGTGQRLGVGKPKQFVEVLGKPLIVYSLEIYENSPLIDAIEVVSVPKYIDYVWELAGKYGISKLRWVTAGGQSCQESTRNGIFNLRKTCKPDDVLMFNMSTSVFVDDQIIKDSLDVCAKYGNAFASMQCIYNNAETFDGVSSETIHFKETHRTINFPWTGTFGNLNYYYTKAYAENIEVEKQSSYMPTLLLALGKKIYLSMDTSLNKLHVTTPEDIEIITAILKYRKDMKENEVLTWN